LVKTPNISNLLVQRLKIQTQGKIKTPHCEKIVDWTDRSNTLFTRLTSSWHEWSTLCHTTLEVY